jgi:iron complex transport system substrate-binding protein
VRRLSFLVPVAVIVMLVSACSKSPSSSPSPAGSASATGAAFPLNITDDEGVSMTLKAAPQRIVTWGPSITESLFAMGDGTKVVGVSGPYDNYPAAAQQIEQVGTPNLQPNIEKVVALKPDLVIAISGGDPWKAQLRKLGIPVFTLNSTNMGDTVHDIYTLGRLTGDTQGAATVASRLQAKIAQVSSALAGVQPVTCFFEVYYPPLSTVGPGSFIFDMLQRAGCAPVSSTAKSQYPTWSVEDLVKQDPSVYLVGSGPGIAPSRVAARPGFDAVSAVKDGKVFVVSSDLVTRPGPRIWEGFAQIANDLHPGIPALEALVASFGASATPAASTSPTP